MSFNDKIKKWKMDLDIKDDIFGIVQYHFSEKQFRKLLKIHEEAVRELKERYNEDNGLDIDKVIDEIFGEKDTSREKSETKGCGKPIPTGVPPFKPLSSRPCGSDPKQLCDECKKLEGDEQ